MNKSAMRSQYKGLRSEYILNSDSAELRSGICRQLLPILKKQSGVWATYCSRADEADPSEAVQQSPWLDWVYPKVSGENLEFYSPQTSEDFETNQWDIKEPIPEKSKEVQLNEISGFLVPGVAFDKEGHRLGQGKGFYDRALKTGQAKKIGVAVKVQISPTPLFREDHDVQMDQVVTEESVVWSV